MGDDAVCRSEHGFCRPFVRAAVFITIRVYVAFEKHVSAWTGATFTAAAYVESVGVLIDVGNLRFAMYNFSAMSSYRKGVGGVR